MPHQLSATTDFEQIMATDAQGREVILVATAEGVRAWRNSCPHVGVGLDYGDGQCLIEPNVLLCSMHGARFDATSGLCTDGPCAGDHLQAVPISIVDGAIYCEGIDGE